MKSQILKRTFIFLSLAGCLAFVSCSNNNQKNLKIHWTGYIEFEENDNEIRDNAKKYGIKEDHLGFYVSNHYTFYKNFKKTKTEKRILGNIIFYKKKINNKNSDVKTLSNIDDSDIEKQIIKSNKYINFPNFTKKIINISKYKFLLPFVIFNSLIQPSLGGFTTEQKLCLSACTAYQPIAVFTVVETCSGVAWNPYLYVGCISLGIPGQALGCVCRCMYSGQPYLHR